MTKIPITIYAESTPNPATLKFVANQLLVEDGASVEYHSLNESSNSPLATQLFQFPFVKSIFIAANYVAITKKDDLAWEEVTLELREFIKAFFADGNVAVKKVERVEVPTDSSFSKTQEVHTQHNVPKNDIENKIIEVLEEYIRPAVEQDGGLIAFRGFEEGIVKVAMKGACSGCPSSTVTLKAGIEGLLKRMVPDVKEVVAEES